MASKIPNLDTKHLMEVVKDKSVQYYNNTIDFLSDNEKLLHSIAKELMEKETLEEFELDDIIEQDMRDA